MVASRLQPARQEYGRFVQCCGTQKAHNASNGVGGDFSIAKKLYNLLSRQKRRTWDRKYIMQQAITIWSVIRSLLHENLSFGAIKAVVGLSGIDMTRLAHLEQRQPPSRSASKSQLLSVIDLQIGAMEPLDQDRFIRITTEEILHRRPDLEPSIRNYLERLGWTLYEGRIVQVEVLDVSELPELPLEAHADLLKAATRFRDGDLSGALSAACGAVDTITAKIYAEKLMGDAGSASFQEKVKKSLAVQDTFTALEKELAELGWNQNDIGMFKQNLSGALTKRPPAESWWVQKLSADLTAD
jgi:hypothetical protein